MYLSPLRYPGGKGKYSKLVEAKAATAPYSRYVEPFSGGAAIALHFAINLQKPVLINDKDPAVYAFWHSVINKSQQLIERIEQTSINLDVWHQCRDVVFFSKKSPSLLDLSFAFFFLNRCNFSGCISARPIGGMKQNSQFKMDARFNKKGLIERIKKIAAFKHLIKITNDDALFLLATKTNSDDFIYLDPPYYEKSEQLYNNYLDKKEKHNQLAHILKISTFRWVLSYDDCEYIRSLYAGHLLHTETVPYSFLRKNKKAELVISAKHLM